MFNVQKNPYGAGNQWLKIEGLLASYKEQVVTLKNAPHACFNLGHEKAKKYNLNNLKDGTTKKLKQNLFMIKYVFTSNVSCTKVSFFLYFKLKISDTCDECIIKKKI
jgi:hypothetical protein